MTSVTARMHKSEGPPTAVGTTTRIGLSGNAAAAAATLTSETHIAPAAAMHDAWGFILIFLETVSLIVDAAVVSNPV
jgi:hypothetical protein